MRNQTLQYKSQCGEYDQRDCLLDAVKTSVLANKRRALNHQACGPSLLGSCNSWVSEVSRSSCSNIYYYLTDAKSGCTYPDEHPCTHLDASGGPPSYSPQRNRVMSFKRRDEGVRIHTLCQHTAEHQNEAPTNGLVYALVMTDSEREGQPPSPFL
jgi:hypothetical protein